jgi:hypothetical protein
MATEERMLIMKIGVEMKKMLSLMKMVIQKDVENVWKNEIVDEKRDFHHLMILKQEFV